MYSQIGFAAFLLGAAVFITCWVFLSPQRQAELPYGNVNDEDESGFNKFIRPLLKNFIPESPMRAAMGKESMTRTEELLVRSGNPWNIRSEEFVGAQILFALFGLILGIILYAFGVFELIPQVPGLIFAPAFAAAGYFIPLSAHRTLVEKRNKEINSQLPEALDLLVISMSSGSIFDSALHEVIPSLSDGILKEEFRRVNKSMESGMTTEAALKEFAMRTLSDDVESFVKAIIQAQKSGDGDITEALSNQASKAREAYENLLEKKIAKLSQTVFIPLAVTMMPALIIITVAPTITQLTGML